MRPCYFVEPLERRQLLSGNGLSADYFDAANFTTRAMSRHDAAVDFDFGTAGPARGVMGADTYSVRWQGQVLTAGAGVYTFYVDADDGVRLTIRGQGVVDRWTDGSAETPGTVELSSNQKVDLKLEYYNNTGAGHVRLLWSGPGIAGKQVVPNANLFDSFGVDYTFTNPIAANGADPWVTQQGGYYYYCRSDGGALYVAKSVSLQGIDKAPAVKIFQPPASTAYSRNLWAPELHFLDNKWYVYFAADNGANANHRMYVLESLFADPQGPYTFKGKIAPTTDRWAIDGTVLTLGANRYFVWSGWPGTTDGQQNLYIAAMSNPWTISGDRVLISSPTFAWERNGLPINEGPEILQQGGNTFVIYSGSGYWTNEYALGQLKLTGTNPLLASSWTKTPTPVFSQNASTVGVGHASFTKSPDGTEDWIVYHAHNTPGTFTGTRDVRAQRFTFNADGSPNFGSPVAPGVALREPAGTPHFTAAFQPANAAAAVTTVNVAPVLPRPSLTTPRPRTTATALLSVFSNMKIGQQQLDLLSPRTDRLVPIALRLLDDLPPVRWVLQR
jgi:GH43 family beta-xylosidase